MLRRARPVEHRRGERAGLRDEGEIARQCLRVREARIEPDARQQHAHAIRDRECASV